MFGEQSKSPVAGMFRFMPLEGANAVLVITPQADYLDDIQQWLERIDGAGDGVQLFSYELKYVKAKDLADRLAEVFGGGGGRSPDGSGAPTLMPGLESTEIKDSGVDDTGNSSAGDRQRHRRRLDGGMGSGMSLNPQQRRQRRGHAGSRGRQGRRVRGRRNQHPAGARHPAGVEVDQGRDRTPRRDAAAGAHRGAGGRGARSPATSSTASTGIFENAVTDAGLPSAVGRDALGTLAGSIRRPPATGGLAWTFLGRNAAAVINALDQVTDVQLLQTPSVVVRNNAEATLNVGSRIPISVGHVQPDGGTGNDGTFSQVQYLDTGVILKVRPRVTKDGMVFLDIVQEVSSPGRAASAADPQRQRPRSTPAS